MLYVWSGTDGTYGFLFATSFVHAACVELYAGCCVYRVLFLCLTRLGFCDCIIKNILSCQIVAMLSTSSGPHQPFGLGDKV